MKVITFGTLKGGTGKTLTCFNLAGLLAEEKRVLLIDLDPQANLSLDAGVDVVSCSGSVKNIFDATARAAEDIIVPQPMGELPCINIIPSSITLTGMELQIANKAGRERFLFNFISDNIDFLQSRYDYIFIDTNPSMSIINQNAFLAADCIVLITDVSLNGIQGAELFMALWGETVRQLRTEHNIAALLINNVDKRIKLSRELLEYCASHEEIRRYLLGTHIPSSVRVKETEMEHKPVNVLHRDSPSHKAYVSLVQELSERSIL